MQNECLLTAPDAVLYSVITLVKFELPLEKCFNLLEEIDALQDILPALDYFVC